MKKRESPIAGCGKKQSEELGEYLGTLERRVDEQTTEIRLQTEKTIILREGLVEGLAILIESRDGSTGQHVHNTKVYVEMILRYMLNHQLHVEEVDENYVQMVMAATVLHDIGKIQISDAILNKPGKLTPEEYEVMKSHTTLGGDILTRIFGRVAEGNMVRIAGDVARYHHERWDGRGYPAGLAEREIPLCARMVAVADAFDAMVSKRVYKEKVDVDQAYRILQEEAGKQFDPEIVMVFCQIRPEVEAYFQSIEE